MSRDYERVPDSAPSSESEITETPSGESRDQLNGQYSLFQTSAWIENWWAYWGREQAASGVFTRVRSRTDLSRCLYIHQYWIRNCLPVTCLQLVGTNYRVLSTPRAEYLGLFAGVSESEARQRIRELLDWDWSEAVFADVLEHGRFATMLREWSKAQRLYMRPIYRDTAYQVRTDGDFETYLKELGPNTRLKFYNRRRLLKTVGRVTLDNAWPYSVDEFFVALNDFHGKRWGAPCYSARSLAFNKDFLADAAKEGAIPQLSVLRVNGNTVSVLYNVWYKNVVYNIQSGFEERFHPKLSLGTLHLGFAIENAFRDPGTLVFDLLAGTGKNSDYKKRIATDFPIETAVNSKSSSLRFDEERDSSLVFCQCEHAA